MNELEARKGAEITEDRLQEIRAEIQAIDRQVKTVVLSAACEIGKRLLEVKLGLPHGRFGQWIRDNVDYSERQVQNMIALYEEFGKHPNEKAENLTTSAAIALLGASAEVRSELIDSGEAGELSVRELKDKIREMETEIAGRQVTIDQLESDAKAREEKLQKAEKEAREAERIGRQATAEKLSFQQSLGVASREKDRLIEENKNLAKQLSEAQTAERIVEIEVTPPEVEKELARLREIAGKAHDAETAVARSLFTRIGREIDELRDQLLKMPDELAGTYRQAFALGLKRRIDILEG